MAVVSTGQLTLTDLNDTKQLTLYLNPNNRTQIYNPNNSTYTPNFTSAGSELVIQPELYISGGDGTNLLPNGATPVANANVVSVTWYRGNQTTTAIAEGGTSDVIATGTASTTDKKLTVKTNIAGNSQIFTCVVVYTDPDTGFNVTCKSAVDIAKITNGTDGSSGINAITAFASNSAVSLPADSAGTVSSYNYSGTDIYVYDGATALVYDGVGTANGKFKIVATATSITAGAITASTSGTARAVVANASAITADTANISYAITGKSLTGATINVTVTQTFNKSKNGSNGSSPTLYRLIPSTNAVQQNISNVYNPTSLTFSATSATGTASPVAYAGRWIIEESTDGTTFTAKYTSTANESSKAYTPSVTNVKAIKAKLYLAGGTTTLLDEQIIPVVKDGATGANGTDAYFLNITTPSGDAFRNSTGSLTVKVELFKGGTTVTPTAFKWYVQDASATTTAGGDTDGGAGWRLLNSTTNYGITNYTTAEITVPASAVSGMEGFKCVATAPTTGIKYSNVAVLRDFQDPITVEIQGANIFKNGEGSVTLTARLLQAGVEIPKTGYTFSWALYSTANALIKTYADTDDTVVVPATDVSGTAYIVCDVIK